jgi:hypothetical protein
MKTLFLLLALGLGIGAASAQGPSPVSTADIRFEKMVYDYGTIKQNSNGDCEFVFTNTGKEPLIIGNCQGSCQCTVPACPKEPVLPGKTGVIKMHYNTKNVGPFTKSVRIMSNAKSGEVTLQIKGTVEAVPVEEPFPQQQKNPAGPVENK